MSARTMQNASSVSDVSHRRAVSAGTAAQARMLNGKIGYCADFIIYAVLLLALAAFTLRGSRSDQLIWLCAAIAGAGSWTLLEYVLHRFVFHRMPLIAGLHGAHHAAPRAYIGTPTWLSLLILGGLFFLIWHLFALNIACGTLSGLIMGWLWYGTVHHVIHHRRPRRLAIALKAASHRHLRHHSAYGTGNFGVTTPVWDYVFGTNIPSRVRANSQRSSGLCGSVHHRAEASYGKQ
jgi:sterol desaturase/sphingolipid hydroxylase (fatty acid hydroxylase superfamily)